MRRAACEEKEWGNGGPGEGESPLNGLHMTCLPTRADVKVESEQVF